MAKVKGKVTTFFVRYVPGHGTFVGNPGETVEFPESIAGNFADAVEFRQAPAKKADDDKAPAGRASRGKATAGSDAGEGQAPA